LFFLLFCPLVTGDLPGSTTSVWILFGFHLFSRESGLGPRNLEAVAATRTAYIRTYCGRLSCASQICHNHHAIFRTSAFKHYQLYILFPCLMLRRSSISSEAWSVTCQKRAKIRLNTRTTPRMSPRRRSFQSQYVSRQLQRPSSSISPRRYPV
jgi:hypothetical protein